MDGDLIMSKLKDVLFDAVETMGLEEFILECSNLFGGDEYEARSFWYQNNIGSDVGIDYEN